MTVLKVATCQFPVSADIEQNASWMTRQLDEAARLGARVAHFPEGALSGYAGTDFETFTGYDWDVLGRASERVRARAAELGICFPCQGGPGAAPAYRGKRAGVLLLIDKGRRGDG